MLGIVSHPVVASEQKNTIYTDNDDYGIYEIEFHHRILYVQVVLRVVPEGKMIYETFFLLLLYELIVGLIYYIIVNIFSS